MKHERFSAVLFAGLLLACAAPAVAQQGAASEGGTARLVEEVAGLRRSLDRLVVLAEGLTANQKIDQLLRRIELKERRLTPLALDHRAAEKDVRDQEVRVKRLEEMLKKRQETLSDQIRQGTDRPDAPTRRRIADLEVALELETNRLDELRRAALRLGDELAEGQEEIAILEEQLQELLE
jgi:chromosome segregation ATPase